MLPLLTLKGNDNALPFVALATMGDGGIALCCLGNAGNVGQWFGVQLLPNVVAWRFIPPSSSSKPVHCLELDHLLFLNRIIFQQGRQCPSMEQACSTRVSFSQPINAHWGGNPSSQHHTSQHHNSLWITCFRIPYSWLLWVWCIVEHHGSTATPINRYKFSHQ